MPPSLGDDADRGSAVDGARPGGGLYQCGHAKTSSACLVAPIGDDYEQTLDVITKVNGKITTKKGEGVRFGPMLGEIEKKLEEDL